MKKTWKYKVRSIQREGNIAFIPHLHRAWFHVKHGMRCGNARLISAKSRSHDIQHAGTSRMCRACGEVYAAALSRLYRDPAIASGSCRAPDRHDGGDRPQAARNAASGIAGVISVQISTTGGDIQGQIG